MPTRIHRSRSDVIRPAVVLLRHRAAGWALAFAVCCLVTPAGAAPADTEPRWEQLTPAERQVLQPLQQEWPAIDAVRKQKWRELAAQFPRLSPDRQALLRSRMTAWARMSPTERTAARLRYQEAKRLSESERQARWKSYQSLPEDQRKALADQAQHRATVTPLKPAAPGVADVQPKSNLVAPRASAPPAAARAIAPGTVRATVGASTRPIDEHPSAPQRLQSNQPKVVASPEFVDRSTLLPRRSPPGNEVVPATDRGTP